MRKYRLLIFMVLIAVFLAACGSEDSEGATTSQNIASSSPTNTVVNNFLYFQYQEAKNNGVELNQISGQDKLSEWLWKQSDNPPEMVPVQPKGGLFSELQYRVTDEKTGYMYQGETDRDGYPDGIGILYHGSFKDDIPTIVYVGNFEEGYYNGYGLLFSEPDGEDSAILLSWVSDPNDKDTLSALYYSFVNYVTYEGTFKEGSVKGKGNQFYCSLSTELNTLDFFGKELIPENIIYTTKVGEFTKFQNGKVDGKAKEYAGGALIYDGEFKDGRYHGKGTLYDGSGNEVYHGKWKNGEKA